MTTDGESGNRDATAPVAGGQTVPEDVTDVLDRLPENERTTLAEQWLKARPEVVGAATKRRRDRFRVFIAIALFVAIAAESLVAAYIAWWAPKKGFPPHGDFHRQDWDTVKDWLTISMVPLAAAASLAAAFWYPTREAD